jgi:hypothetical protein
VAIVEDFFDIIYAMHVDITSDPGKSPKHAGQKKTYRAVSSFSKSPHTCVVNPTTRVLALKRHPYNRGMSPISA